MNIITTIGALYVVVPALLALAAVLFATFCPTTINETREEIHMSIYRAARDMHAKRCIQAMAMVRYWRAQYDSTGAAQAMAHAAVWASEALDRHNKACEYNDMVTQCCY